MIADQQGFLHGSGGYFIVLKQKNIDQGHSNDREDQGIKPFNEFAVFTIPLFPEGPVHLPGDIHIENDAQSE
jgi:hypothetical protein